MAVGIRRFFRIAAPITVSASTALVTTTLTSALPVNQKQKIRIWLPFTVGATGGFKFQLVLPSGATVNGASYRINDPVTPQTILAFNANNNAFANALAQAGTHWLDAEFDVVNGANAGNADLQFACNSAANGITVLAGGSMEVIAL